jgi:hypothetical protein
MLGFLDIMFHAIFNSIEAIHELYELWSTIIKNIE